MTSISSEATADDEAVSMEGRRPAGPNVVTYVDGVAVWNLSEDEREPFLGSLRSLAEAGWSETFFALAPLASRRIDHSPL